MKLTINVDPDQLHDIIKASLVEYHDYLTNADWLDGNCERLDIVKAFELVLEQYMSPSEYEAYIAKFVN